MLALDTTASAQAAQDAAYARMSPGEKLQVALDLSSAMLDYARCGIRLRHPDLDDDGVARALIKHLHGIDVPAR